MICHCHYRHPQLFKFAFSLKLQIYRIKKNRTEYKRNLLDFGTKVEIKWPELETDDLADL
jgi:hypothetical protein